MSASGITALQISAPFWGLVAGVLFLGCSGSARRPPRRPHDGEAHALGVRLSPADCRGR